MTARALIKSPTAQRSSPSLTSPGASMPQLPNQSVQADGMRDRLPSGSTTNNNGTPRRVRPLITARRDPWKGCRLRVMTTEVGRSWEWVVCGVFRQRERNSSVDRVRERSRPAHGPGRRAAHRQARAAPDPGLLDGRRARPRDPSRTAGKGRRKAARSRRCSRMSCSMNSTANSSVAGSPSSAMRTTATSTCAAKRRPGGSWKA